MSPIERRLLPVLVVVGSIILLNQGLDLGAIALGADLETSAGRLGLVAFFWTRGPVLLAADAFLVLAAVRLNWTLVLAGLAVGHLLVGLAALAEAPQFMADAGRMAGSVTLPQLAGFRITVARLLAMLMVAGLGGVIAAGSLVQGLRASRKAA
jgi:hypothetical protein